MEVTNSNFNEILPEIEKTIKESTFLAIDCEFSGLNIVSESHAFNTPKQYYAKVLKNCKEFLVLQYGISAFRFDPNTNKFKNKSYNFYIFRRPINRNIPDQRFLCQASSVNFLITQGFDFNKLFKSGISYLNLVEETNYREKLEEKYKLRANKSAVQSTNDVIPIPEESEPFIDDVIKQIETFLQSEDVELQLPKCNAFIRRLIYQTVGEKFANRVILQTKQIEKNRLLVATKFKSKAQQEETDKKEFQDEIAELDNFVGFTKILQLIVDSEKLVIGHNMCMDFVHTIDKFLTPLTSDYDEFKECAHSLFTRILDTKFMASADDFKDLITSTVLADVLESISKAPFKICTVEPENDSHRYSVANPKEHEAGYDAYITGLCFIAMWNHLGGSKEGIFADFSLVQPFINKLHMMASKDVYIDLAGPDPNPSRDHVFYLTFPKEWKLSNLIELFSPFGNVFVSWINDTSAYIGLFKREQAPVVLSTLSQSDTYSIKTYVDRQKELDEFKVSRPDFNSRKRNSDFTPPVCRKKFKTDTSGSFREEVESESGLQKKGKTFSENNTWE